MKIYAYPQFWAILLASLGTGLAITVYVLPGDVASKQVGFQIANSLVSGALGAFVTHLATQAKSPDNPEGR